MDYFIATLIKAEPQKYQDKLTKEIEIKFNITHSKTPSHITLIPPFKTNNIKDIEKKIQNFVKNNKPTKYTLKDIGNFEDKVIFIDVKPSKEMETQYNNLIKILNYIPKIKPHLHLTLAKRLSQNKFNQVREFLKDQKPNFEMELSNIAILELKNSRWEIYKEFKL